jgi:hypothetical protein
MYPDRRIPHETRLDDQKQQNYHCRRSAYSTLTELSDDVNERAKNRYSSTTKRLHQIEELIRQQKLQRIKHKQKI